MRERRGRPMLLIDLAVPRSIEPAVNDLDGVYLFDVDDLDGVIAENRGARATEALRAETIVDAEVEAFWRWLQGLDVVPTIVALREQARGDPAARGRAVISRRWVRSTRASARRSSA